MEEKELTREYMTNRRQEVLQVVNTFMKAHKDIDDTPGIQQEVIHIGSTSISVLVFGHKGDKRESKVTEKYRKSFLLLEGAVQFLFEDGTVVELNEENEFHQVKDTCMPYISEALEDHTFVVVKLVHEN